MPETIRTHIDRTKPRFASEVKLFEQKLYIAQELSNEPYASLFGFNKSGKDSGYSFRTEVDLGENENIKRLLGIYLEKSIDLFNLYKSGPREFVKIEEPLEVERQLAKFERALECLKGSGTHIESLKVVLSEMIADAILAIEEANKNSLKEMPRKYNDGQINSFYTTQKGHVIKIGKAFGVILDDLKKNNLRNQ